jgi:Transcription factor WhiB
MAVAGGSTPCRTSDPEAWWPDRGEVGGFAARMALDACTICAARDAYLAYALAADEAEGIWGGMLPADHQTMHGPMAA